MRRKRRSDRVRANEPRVAASSRYDISNAPLVERGVTRKTSGRVVSHERSSAASTSDWRSAVTRIRPAPVLCITRPPRASRIMSVAKSSVASKGSVGRFPDGSSARGARRDGEPSLLRPSGNRTTARVRPRGWDAGTRGGDPRSQPWCPPRSRDGGAKRRCCRTNRGDCPSAGDEHPSCRRTNRR